MNKHTATPGRARDKYHPGINSSKISRGNLNVALDMCFRRDTQETNRHHQQPEMYSLKEKVGLVVKQVRRGKAEERLDTSFLRHEK